MEERGHGVRAWKPQFAARTSPQEDCQSLRYTMFHSFVSAQTECPEVSHRIEQYSSTDAGFSGPKLTSNLAKISAWSVL